MPKGIVHNFGGFFIYVKHTIINKFGLKKESTMLTASDIGWLNGHNYSLYGPLSVGATTIVLESPMILLNSKELKKILNLGVNILYLPVTLIRLMKSVSAQFLLLLAMAVFPKRKLERYLRSSLGYGLYWIIERP